MKANTKRRIGEALLVVAALMLGSVLTSRPSTLGELVGRIVAVVSVALIAIWLIRSWEESPTETE
jgi:high-affinity Fe2+/Pb2+ permease